MKTVIPYCFLLVSLLGGVIAQQCTGDYTTCCPALDTKQITISGKELIVHCSKNIVATPNKASTPKACVDLCIAEKDCVNSFWQEPGVCWWSKLADVPSKPKQRSIALLPVLSVLPDTSADCKKNITTAVDLKRNADIVECNGNITTAVNAAKGAKDQECLQSLNAAKDTKDQECLKNLNAEKEACQKKVNAAAAKLPAYSSTPAQVCGPGRTVSRHGRSWQVWNDCKMQGPRFGLSDFNLDGCLRHCINTVGCYLAHMNKPGVDGGARDGKCTTMATKEHFETIVPGGYGPAGKHIFGPWPLRSYKISEPKVETWVLL